MSKSFKIPATGGNSGPKIPPGSYAAYAISVIDLGMQQTKGQYAGVKHQVQLTFEVPEVVVEFESESGSKTKAPAVIGQRFTYSMHKKAGLRKFIESLAGKSFATDEEASEFDLAKLLGKQFLINVEHVTRGDKTYANLKSVGPCPKQMKSATKQHHASWLYVLADPDPSLFAQFPEWLQNVINGRIKANDTSSSVAPPSDLNDDIPF